MQNEFEKIAKTGKSKRKKKKPAFTASNCLLLWKTNTGSQPTSSERERAGKERN